MSNYLSYHYSRKQDIFKVFLVFITDFLHFLKFAKLIQQSSSKDLHRKRSELSITVKRTDGTYLIWKIFALKKNYESHFTLL